VVREKSHGLESHCFIVQLAHRQPFEAIDILVLTVSIYDKKIIMYSKRNEWSAIQIVKLDLYVSGHLEGRYKTTFDFGGH
jgi:hypothetical protein